MAAARRWVLNDKGLVDEAGLLAELALLVDAGSPAELDRAMEEILGRVGAG